MLPECESAVALFSACDTQWVYSGMAGVRTGLNYAGVRAAAQMMNIEDMPHAFEGLRIIEHTVLAVDKERADKDGGQPAEGKPYRNR